MRLIGSQWKTADAGDPSASTVIIISNPIRLLVACLNYRKRHSELRGTGVLTVAGLIGNCALLPLVGVDAELFLLALGKSAAAESAARFLGGTAGAETLSL